MKARRAVSWIAAVAIVAFADEAAAACPFQRPPATIRIHVDPGRVAYDHRLDAGGILRRGGEALSGRPAHAVPRGLTVARFEMGLQTEVGFGRLGGVACAWPRAVDVSLGFGVLTVYIDRKYARGTCEYDTVRRHEDTHVALHRKTLAKYATEAERYVRVAIDQRPWFAVATRDQARQVYGLYLQKVLEPVLARMGAEDRALNAAIDQKPIYLATQTQCANW